MRGARFLCKELAPDVFARVPLQGHARKATLLRTIMHQAMLADVEEARACAAAPFIRHAKGYVFLKAVQPGITQLAQPSDLVKYGLSFF